MTGRHFLHVPGPTNGPGRIMNAMGVVTEDHGLSIPNIKRTATIRKGDAQ